MNIVQVKVTTKAKTNRIVQEKMTDGSVRYKIYVTTIPEQGKANAAVIKLLSKELKLPKSSLIIMRGLTSCEKLIQINR